MSRLKVMILTDTLMSFNGAAVGGAEKQIRELCRLLDAKKYDITVGCLSIRAGLLSEIKRLGAKTVQYNINRIYGPWGIMQGIRLYQYLKKEDVDILMTYHFGSDIWGTIFGRLAGVPIIISNRRDAGFWRNNIHKTAYRLINKWVNKIVVVSESVKKMVINEEGIAEEKVELVYNGLDLSIFDSRQQSRSGSRILDLPPGARVIGCVGNVRPIKGHSYLADAAKKIIAKFPEAHFILVGRDDPNGSLAGMIKDMNLDKNFHFLGIRNDIPEILQSVDICVLPSLSEGLSNTLLEYMAAGKPIVATRVGGNTDLINDRVNGLLAAPADAEDLAEKIIYLLQNEEEGKRLGSKAKEDVSNKFSITQMVRNYETLFNRLRQEKDPAPAVVLGMSANGLSIARSLGRKGIPVIGVATSKKECGMYSKYLKTVYTIPNPIYDEEGAVAFLIYLAGEMKRKAALFATADDYIELLSKYKKKLIEYYDFPLPDQSTVETFIDKEKSHTFALKNNISCPNTWFIRDTTDVEQIAKEVNFPVIIKPCVSHLWREKFASQKVVVARTYYELKHGLEELREKGLKVMVQEIIPGPDGNVYEFMAYCDSDARLLAYFCGRKLRQYPPHFGVGCFAESIEEPSVIAFGKEFLEKTRYTGLIHIEIKVDPRSNMPVFLEANLRTSFIGELSIASGVDLPYIAYRDMAGFDDKQPAHFIEGVKLMNLELDLGSLYRYRKTGEWSLGKWMMSLKSKKLAHVYFAADDIAPWFMEYSRFLTRMLLKLFGKGRVSDIKPKRSQQAILHIISSNGLFGAERVMLNVASGINNYGMRSWVAAIVNTHNEHLEVVEEAKKRGIPANIFMSRGRFDIKTVRDVARFVKENGIDIIHTHNYKSNMIGYLAAKKAGIPIITTVHGYINSGVKLRLYEWLDRILVRRFDKIVLVDDSLRKYFKGLNGKIEVINNGVRADNAGAPQASAPKEPLVIGTVGRLSAEKGHKYLLEAYAKIVTEISNTRLLIVGSGELSQELEDLAGALGIKDKVDFVGYQKDVRSYYQMMDIYVSPSLVEHFPMSILEAMSFGKSIVATNVGGTSRLIKNGETGILIESESAQQLAAGMASLCRDEEKRGYLGNGAYRAVKERFSLEAMRDNYSDIYSEVVR